MTFLPYFQPSPTRALGIVSEKSLNADTGGQEQMEALWTCQQLLNPGYLVHLTHK